MGEGERWPLSIAKRSGIWRSSFASHSIGDGPSPDLNPDPTAFSEEHQFPGFRSSPECALFVRGLRRSFERTSEGWIHVPEGSAGKVEERAYSFQLIKINDRGKRQERALRLDKTGYSNMRGDTERFKYLARDIHGMHLDQATASGVISIHSPQLSLRPEARSVTSELSLLTPTLSG